MQSPRARQTGDAETVIRKKYAEKLLSSLDYLRTWDIISDCTLKVGSESFPVHSPVLAAASKYFYELITAEDLPVKDRIFEVEDMSANTLRDCIEFMYTGNVCLTSETVYEVLSASEVFKLEHLTELCLDYLCDHLSIDNFSDVKRLLEKHGHGDKIVKIDAFLSEQFENATGTTEYLNLDKRGFQLYLKTENLDHVLAWHALKRWIDFKYLDRRQYYFELITLNSHIFPTSFMLESIWDDRLTKKSQRTKEFIGDALLKDIDAFRDGLTCSNCFNAKQVCEVTKHPDCNEGHSEVRLFIIKHFEDLSDNDGIVTLTKDEMYQIFRSPKTKCSSETVKWNVAHTWVDHDPGSRSQYFPSLLSMIKLENMPINFLQEVVRVDEMVQQFDECKEMIMDAFYVIANPGKGTSKQTPGTPQPKRDATPKSLKSRNLKRSSKVISKDPESSPLKSGQRKQMVDYTSPASKRLRRDVEVSSVASQVVSSSTDNPHVAVFDPATGKVKGLDLSRVQWHDIASTKVTKDEYQGIVSIQNRLYLLKGTDFFVLNSTKKSWDKLPSKQSKPAKWSQMVVYENDVYVLQDGHYDMFSVVEEKWLENEPFVSHGEGFCSCLLLNTIYTIGGAQEPTRARKYDILTKSVSNVESTTVGRMHASAVSLKGKVYVFGGAVNLEQGFVTESYNPVSDSWVTLSNMQVKRIHLSACTYNGKIYAIGGGLPKTGAMDSLEVYEMASKGKYKWRILHRMLRMGDSLSTCIVDIPYKA